MKFLDEVNVAVAAGRGGNGCVSFRRERFIANGGPDGGNGGSGGSIYLEAEANLNTLIEFRYQAQHKATSGTSGSKRNRTGASGEDLYLKVPVGTEVFVLDTNEHIGDLTRPGQQLLVAQGGKGGVGNHCFKSGANRSPKEHTVGTLGEARDLRLSLKLLADVGLVGLPNAGKSTFIRSVSNAKPKVADYPFTTLAPKLGVVRVDTDSHFVIADIPGLIEGAASGSGLGLQFLKHLERTKLLLHIVDIAPVDGSDPIQNIQLIDQELQQYGHTLQDKPRWIVFNKLDVLPLSEQESVCDTLIQRLRNEYSELDYPAFTVSSIQSQGTTRLCQQIFQLLDHSIIS